MNFKSLLYWVLGAAATAIVQSGCQSVSSGPIAVQEPAPYAIVAVDAQGALSQTELNAIEDSLVQDLLDQHYVRTDQVLVADPNRAAIVFQFKITWNQDRSSFAIASVTPEYGGGALPASPPPGYATQGPPPYAPPAYNGWENDPWNYDPWGWDNGYGGGWYPYGPSVGGRDFPGHRDPRDHDRDEHGDRDGHSDRDRNRDRDSHRDRNPPPGDRPFPPHQPPAWEGDNGSHTWHGEHGSRNFPPGTGPGSQPERAPVQQHDSPRPGGSNFRRGPVAYIPRGPGAPLPSGPVRQVTRMPRFAPPPPRYSPPPRDSRPAAPAPAPRAPAPPPRNEPRSGKPEK